jgi:hypothetical protein
MRAGRGKASITLIAGSANPEALTASTILSGISLIHRRFRSPAGLDYGRYNCGTVVQCRPKGTPILELFAPLYSFVSGSKSIFLIR